MGQKLDSYKMISIIKNLVMNINNENVYFKAREYESIQKVIHDHFDNSYEAALKWIADNLRITNYVETVYAEDDELKRVDMHVFKSFISNTQIYLKVALTVSIVGTSTTIIISLHEWKEKTWK